MKRILFLLAILSATATFIGCPTAGDSTDPLATNATLSALSLTGFDITPAFAVETTSYTATVPNATTSITVIAAAADIEKATVEVTGNTSLIVGENTVNVKITAEDEKITKTYTIIVTRDVASIDTSAADVATVKSALEITYTTGDIASSVTGNVTLPTTGANGVTISWASDKTNILNTGVVARPTAGAADQVVTLTATITKAPSGNDTKAFTLTVKALPSVPTYMISYNTHDATGTEPTDNNEYEVGAIATLDNGNGLTKSGYNFIGWRVSNTGTLYTTSYTMGSTNVVLWAQWEAKSIDATLSTLSLTGVAISPVFSPTKISYTANVANGVTSVEINATKNDAKATITGDTGIKAVSVGSGNVFNVVVTAENGIAIYIYTITVTRAAPVVIHEYAAFTESGTTYTKTTPGASLSEVSGTSTSGIVAATYNNSQYVAITVIGTTYTKTNASDEFTSVVTDTNANLFVALVYNGSQYVAFNESGSAYTKTSTTNTFTVSTVASGGLSGITAVVYNGSQYVAFTSDGITYTKTNLSDSFALVSSSSVSGIIAAVYNGSQYVAFTSGGSTYIKTNVSDSFTTAITDGFTPIKAAAYK